MFNTNDPAHHVYQCLSTAGDCNLCHSNAITNHSPNCRPSNVLPPTDTSKQVLLTLAPISIFNLINGAFSNIKGMWMIWLLVNAFIKEYQKVPHGGRGCSLRVSNLDMGLAVAYVKTMNHMHRANLQVI